MLNIAPPYEDTFRAARLSRFFDEIDYNMFDNAECIAYLFDFKLTSNVEKDTIPIIAKYEDSIFIAAENTVFVKDDYSDSIIETAACLNDEVWDDFRAAETESHGLEVPYGSFDPSDFYWKTNKKEGKARPLCFVSFYLEENAVVKDIEIRLESFFQNLKDEQLINF